MFGVAVDVQEGMTGDQIIELIKQSHQRGLELQKESEADLVSCSSSKIQSSKEESSEEDALAAAFAEIECYNGFGQNYDEHREAGSGAKTIKRLLALEDENELLQDDYEQSLLRQKTMDKPKSAEMLEYFQKEGGKQEENKAKKYLNQRAANLRQRNTDNGSLKDYGIQVEWKRVTSRDSQGELIQALANSRFVLPTVMNQPYFSTKTDRRGFLKGLCQSNTQSVQSPQKQKEPPGIFEQFKTGKPPKHSGFSSTTSGGFSGVRSEARSQLKNIPKAPIYIRNMSRLLLDESRVPEIKPSTSAAIAISNRESKNDEGKPQYPRTGIEQPFLIVPPSHNRDTNDLERVNDHSSIVKQTIIEEYRMRESSRVINLAKTVYDAEKDSPHYRGQEEFIDSAEQVRITKSTVNGRAIENLKPTLKNRYFKHLKPWYKPYQFTGERRSVTAEQDDVLIFESRFESGNLKEAIQLDRSEYELVLKPDYGTKNYTQWYYFRFSNTRRYREYIFHIINFMKPDSLYNEGMLPLFYSKKYQEQNNIGWHRAGYDIAYYQNNQPYCKIYGESQTEASKNSKEPNTFYTLSLKFTLKYDNDDIYIAMCYPYTYTDCMKFLDSTVINTFNQNILRRTSLCKTLAGNSLDMLIITNFHSPSDQIAKRKCLILTARVHPGESNSSFIMEGLIQFILSNDEAAIILRDRFVFKIVPMLNPDGVIVGNYRCSLTGHDLNRQYLSPSPKTFPEVFAVKTMIRKTLECRKIELYCDFHGHSRQKDLFMYGCSLLQGQSFSSQQSEKCIKERIFPFMFDRQSCNFNYQGCSFYMHKSKESTGRVVMWKEFQLYNSYTCEASFCGPSQGYFHGFHFNIKMLLDMGKEFCRTLKQYSDPDPTYYRILLSELQYEIQKENPKEQQIEEGSMVTNKTRLGKITAKIKSKKGKEELDSLKGILNVVSKSAKAKKQY